MGTLRFEKFLGLPLYSDQLTKLDIYASTNFRGNQILMTYEQTNNKKRT